MLSKLFCFFQKLLKLCLPYGVIRFYQIGDNKIRHNIMTLLENNGNPIPNSESDKKTVLYDASLIAYNWHQNKERRGGLYFVAYHILAQMANSNHYDIKVYSHALDDADIFCDRKHLKNLQAFLKYEKLPNVSMLQFSKIAILLYQFIFLSKYIHIKLYNKLFSFLKKNIVKNRFCFDIYFSPYHKIPNAIQKNQYIKKYIFFHDTVPILFPQYYNGNGWFPKTFFPLFNSLNKTDYYFSNSASTKKDFLKFNSILTPEQVQVTLLGVSSNFYPCPDKKDEVLKKYNIAPNMKYTFMLGALEPRKNLIRIIKTLLQFIKKHNLENFIILIGGAITWKTVLKKLQEEFQGLEKEKIILLGYVADEDLAPLYSGAEFFVYTSQYEGFGLPPLEAMKCGCPVITSNNSSLPEVVGDAGIMIDYDSDEQHIQAYEKYYFDKEYANEMREKGFKRAEQFTWDKCFEIIDKAMEEREKRQ